MATKISVQKDVMRLVIFICILGICIASIWSLGKTTRIKSSSPDDRFFKIPKESSVPRPLPSTPFHPDAEILKSIRDDEYLERSDLYYVLHQIIATPEKEIESSIDKSLTWKIMLQTPQRDQMRGKIMQIQGCVIGVQPLVLGQSSTCHLLREDDFQDLSGLITKLRDIENPVSRHIVGLVAPDTRKLVNDYNAFLSTVPKSLKNAILYEFNALLEKESLYDEQSFAQVNVSEEIKKVLSTKPHGYALIRGNRLLLEQAYPREIKKTQDAESRDMQGVRIWVGTIYTEQQEVYLCLLPDLPKHLPESAEVKITGAFLKVWTYVNQHDDKIQAPVLIGKTLHIIPQGPPPSSRGLLRLIGFAIGVVAIFIIVGILYERREHSNFNKHLMEIRNRRKQN